MLSEITAVTQLILVLEVAYLMLHCRQFRLSAPDIIDDVETRHDQALRRWDDLRKLLDEIADGLYDEGQPMDMKLTPMSILTHFLNNKMAMPSEHGSTQESVGEIHEVPTQKDIEIQEGNRHSEDSIGSDISISDDETIV